MKDFIDNEHAVEYIKKYCTDEEFTEAVSGFFVDAATQQDAVKHRALTQFLSEVDIDNDGKPTIDEVRLLDIYEEMLASMETE